MGVVEVERSEHVALVRLNRPEARNALDPEMVVALGDTWESLRADDDVRVCVLSAAASSCFCAGFDLGTFVPLLTGGPPADHWGERIAADPTAAAARATLRDIELGKPLIAAVNGHAVGGGLELMLASDLRVVADTARLGAGAVNLGLILTMGGTARLARQLHAPFAAELLLTGAPISAAQALAGGLINRVEAADDVLSVALELAAAIAANAPLAVRAACDIIRSAGELTDTELLALERRRGHEVQQTLDAVEGPRAFMAKRPARFLGR